jgi:hypothetical protein
MGYAGLVVWVGGRGWVSSMTRPSLSLDLFISLQREKKKKLVVLLGCDFLAPGLHVNFSLVGKQCLLSATAELKLFPLLNGSPFGHFRPSWDLRQGDPFSSFLFIIGTETLSRLLYYSFRSFKVSQDCLALNHLLFVDDLVIFTSATSSEASVVTTCLDKYSLWSGQSVNVSKSNILFSKNTAISTISGSRDFFPIITLQFQRSIWDFPCYLVDQRKVLFFRYFGERIEGWCFKTLSQAEKSVIIKVVASFIPSYAMSSFLLPNDFCHKLDMAFKKFWCCIPKGKSHNLSLKSWSSLCLPKDQGGFDFRLMKDVNISLLSKLGRKLLSDHDCLWVSLFKTKYVKYGNLLTSPLPIGSFIWNGIKSIVFSLDSYVT